jgi:glucose-1-phosphate adenylyltransferase
MARQPSVVAVVQAGGQGSRMDVLTRERAKPALPFAGTYRLVDFVLSSLSHSGIRDVWLSVQYQAGSLDSVVSGGRPWDLDRTRGGFRRVVPEQGSGSAAESGFSRGNADDLLRMRDDLERSGADVVLVASADHVFAMDLAELVDAHVSSGADATVVTADVGRDEARHNVVVHTRGATVTGVEVKPSSPGATTVATELFVYSAGTLLHTLDDLRRELAARAEGDDSGLGDFGEHLLPRLVERGTVRAVPIGGYWRDVGRPESYLAAHRDVLAGGRPRRPGPSRPDPRARPPARGRPRRRGGRRLRHRAGVRGAGPGGRVGARARDRRAPRRGRRGQRALRRRAGRGRRHGAHRDRRRCGRGGARRPRRCRPALEPAAGQGHHAHRP